MYNYIQSFEISFPFRSPPLGQFWSQSLRVLEIFSSPASQLFLSLRSPELSHQKPGDPAKQITWGDEVEREKPGTVTGEETEDSTPGPQLSPNLQLCPAKVLTPEATLHRPAQPWTERLTEGSKSMPRGAENCPAQCCPNSWPKES